MFILCNSGSYELCYGIEDGTTPNLDSAQYAGALTLNRIRVLPSLSVAENSFRTAVVKDSDFASLVLKISTVTIVGGDISSCSFQDDTSAFFVNSYVHFPTTPAEQDNGLLCTLTGCNVSAPIRLIFKQLLATNCTISIPNNGSEGVLDAT